MLKADALRVFKGVVRLAEAIGCKHPSVSRLPAVLDQSKADQIRGAMVRLGMQIPAYMRNDKLDRQRLELLQQQEQAQA